jgi:hypothetical protein
MTTAFDQDRASRRTDGTAANDDHVGHANAFNHLRANSSTVQSAETGGWDAYDVWRRLIKEARERRAGRTFPE